MVNLEKHNESETVWQKNHIVEGRTEGEGGGVIGKMDERGAREGRKEQE